MSSLNSLYIKKETLEKLVSVLNQKGEKGIELTIAVNDETNEYGQNISSYVSQTEEQRKAKKDRFYTGNGKTFWTDGNIKVAEKKQNNQTSSNQSNSNESEDNSLPF